MSVTKGFPNGKKGSGTQLFSRDGDLSASALYRLVFLILGGSSTGRRQSRNKTGFGMNRVVLVATDFLIIILYTPFLLLN